MFFSHQLLSKRHRMGQIWIAATIRASINRKKAARIGIEQIYKHILNPPIPPALRLSGIFMGGTVHIYDWEVHFLYEDLNAILIKIKVDATQKDVDRTTLPKRKYRSKCENISMAIKGFQVSENIERPMRQPSIPLQEGGNTLEEMFFVGADNGENFADNTSPRDQFQAAVEDITLNPTLKDNVPYSPLSVGGWHKNGLTIFAESILGPMDDFMPEFQLSGPRSTPEFNPVENCVPAGIIPDPMYLQVFVRTLSSRTVVLMVHLKDSIYVLKTQLRKRDFTIPPKFDQFQIIYNGIVLQNNKTVSESLILNDSTLTVVGGLRGGASGELKRLEIQAQKKLNSTALGLRSVSSTGPIAGSSNKFDVLQSIVKPPTVAPPPRPKPPSSRKIELRNQKKKQKQQVRQCERQQPHQKQLLSSLKQPQLSSKSKTPKTHQ